MTWGDNSFGQCDVRGANRSQVAIAGVPGTTLVIRRPAACAEDWNDDGSVTSTDVAAFISTWVLSLSIGGHAADFDGSGVVPSTDISAFLTTWLTAVQGGC